MNDARANILRRLRRVDQANGDALDRTPESHAWSREERIQRFSDCMRAVRAEIHRVDRHAWTAKLLDIIAAKGLGNLLYAPTTDHGRVLAAAAGEGAPELLAYEAEIEHWKDRLFNAVDGALTGSRGAIAETGSLILWPDADEPRLMSLVPPLHLVLLEADKIYSTFAEAVQQQGWADAMPTNALLISGPSKSADIEQTLAYGVHGPKQLVVLVLE